MLSFAHSTTSTKIPLSAFREPRLAATEIPVAPVAENTLCASKIFLLSPSPFSSYNCCLFVLPGTAKELGDLLCTFFLLQNQHCSYCVPFFSSPKPRRYCCVPFFFSKTNIALIVYLFLLLQNQHRYFCVYFLLSHIQQINQLSLPPIIWPVSLTSTTYCSNITLAIVYSSILEGVGKKEAREIWSIVM